jgi:hypothetical protein
MSSSSLVYLTAVNVYFEAIVIKVKVCFAAEQQSSRAAKVKV